MRKRHQGYTRAKLLCLSAVAAALLAVGVYRSPDVRGREGSLFEVEDYFPDRPVEGIR